MANKAYSLKRLWGNQEEICRLFALGTKRQILAEKFGVTPQTISNIVNSDLGRRKIAVLQGKNDIEATDVQSRIRALQPVALETFEELLLDSNSSPKLQKEIASEILRMGGNGPVTKNQTTTTFQLSDEDLEQINSISDGIRRSIGDAEIVEASFTETSEQNNA